MDKLLHCIDIFFTLLTVLVSFVYALNFSENTVELVLSERVIKLLAGVSVHGGKI